MNPLRPKDAGELWPQLLKDRKQLKKRAAQKRAAVISGTVCFTLELLCAFFGYVYLFFEDRLVESFEKLPAVKRFFDLICNHILSRGEMKWYFSLAITVGLLFVLPTAVSLVFKLITALFYHPKVTEPCPDNGDEEIAEKLFRFADDSFELNLRLNDRGKTPKIVSMVSTAVMAGLSIYGFIAATGAQIKVSIPLLVVGLILLVVSLFFVVYGLETLISLLIKLLYYRSDKNIYDFRTAAEEMYNSLCAPTEQQADISEQSGDGTPHDIADAADVSDTVAAESGADAADSTEASPVSPDDLPLEGFSVVAGQSDSTYDTAPDAAPDNTSVPDDTCSFDAAAAYSDDVQNAARPGVSDPAPSDDTAIAETVDANDTADDDAADGTAITDTSGKDLDAGNAVPASAAVGSAAAGAAATGAAAADSIISKAADRGMEGSLSKTELKKHSPSLWTPLLCGRKRTAMCIGGFGI